MNSRGIAISCGAATSRPSIYRRPTAREKEKRNAGRNDTPPNRGTAPVCDLRALSSSNSFFFFEIITMRGMVSHPAAADSKKVAMTSKVNSISWQWSFLTGVVSAGKGTKITDTEHSNI